MKITKFQNYNYIMIYYIFFSPKKKNVLCVCLKMKNKKVNKKSTKSQQKVNKKSTKSQQKVNKKSTKNNKFKKITE